MRYPDFLKTGDTIGFAAPSFGCATEPYQSAFNNALRKFREMGYQTLLGPNCYSGTGIGISNTPEACGKELTEIYCGDLGDCKAVMACGGGELMCQTMEHVDLERVRKAEPKWYSGYSDNTNFIVPLVTMCDTAAIYAPCAPAFGMEPWHQNLQDVFDILTGKKFTVSTYGKWESESLKDAEHPLEPYHCTEDTILHIFVPDAEGRLTELTGESGADEPAKPAGDSGPDKAAESAGESGAGKEDAAPAVSMRGRLLGGCIDILCTLSGTDLDHVREFQKRYEKDGIIWFLEACDLDPISIRRAMWQMEHTGWFDNAKGFLIGRPFHFHEPAMGMNQYDAVLDIAGRHGVPVIMDADVGHLPPMMPLIAGSLADVTAAGNRVTVDMHLV